MKHVEVEEEQPILDSYEAYGCRVNSIDLDELFERYERVGFLYPAKLQWLSPYWPLIVENWRRALRAGELIHWILTRDDPATDSWASITSWRSTNNGWTTQHLVSTGNPLASRAVMLSASAVLIKDRFRAGFDHSHQNWFRPSNRYANRIFGSLVETVGPAAARVNRFSYVAMPPLLPRAGAEGICVVAGAGGHRAELVALVASARGDVLVRAEEFDRDDLELEALDALYQRVGLRRYRRIFLARQVHSDALLGAAVAYRGPLGFNLSFLENRCDLIVAPGLSEAIAGAVGLALLGAVEPTYADFPPGLVLVVTDARTATNLIRAGGTLIRDYNQSAWLCEGFVAYYRHLEHFYNRVLRSEHRGGLARRMA